MSHRTRTAVVAVLITVLVLAGCSSGSTTGADAGADGTPTPSDAGAFPVTLEHAFGSTTLTEAPERIVVVGFKEQDYYLALGEVPVAIRDWYGNMPSATWPWAQSYLRGQTPTVLPRADLSYEQIAALEPDVIVGASAGLTSEQYDLLSQIAPTVAQPAGDGSYEVSWQEMARIAGQVTGKVAESDALVSDLEARIAAVATDHPALDGASFTFASAFDGSYYLFSDKTTAGKLLSELGLVMTLEAAAISDNAEQQYLVSAERFDLLDADLVIWSEGVDDPGPEGLLQSQLYTMRSVHTDGRDVFLGKEPNGALVFSSVLSIPYVLDQVVPALEAAVDGSPSTRSALSAP